MRGSLRVATLVLSGCGGSPDFAAERNASAGSRTASEIFQKFETVKRVEDLLPGEPVFTDHRREVVYTLNIIDWGDDFFGYGNGVRPPDVKVPKGAQAIYELYTKAEVPVVRVEEPPSPIVLASFFHNGSNRVAYVGVFEGKPVAVLRWIDPPTRAKVLRYARSAMLASDLGIGPIFFGIITDCARGPGIVMSIARGDMPDADFRLITPEAFRELIAIDKRMSDYGVRVNNDFQTFTDGRHVLSIDNEPARFLDAIGRLARGVSGQVLEAYYLIDFTMPLNQARKKAQLGQLMGVVDEEYPAEKAERLRGKLVWK